MKFSLLLISGLILNVSLSLAQKDFRPGYLITLDGDTVFGDIDYRGDITMAEVCTFKAKDSIATVEYSPSDISGYRFLDSKYFISKDFGGKKLFLEFLVKGKVSVYYSRDRTGDHYYVEKANAKLIELPYIEEERNIEGKQYLYRSKKHIGILNAYMNDAPELQPQISGVTKPEHQTLIKLAEDYHNKICKDTSCIVYEKKKPRLFSLELICGIVNYTGGNPEYIDPVGAAIINISFRRLSEKIYFRTGISVSNIKFDGRKYQLIRIPLQLEYIYPRGRFRPKLAYGVALGSINPDFGPARSWMLGANFKLNKRIYWAFNYDIDFAPKGLFVVWPTESFLQSLSTGLYIKL